MPPTRAGIRTVFLPKDIAKDIPDLPDSVRQDLTLIPVNHLSEILDIALLAGNEDSLATDSTNGNLNVALTSVSGGTAVPPMRAADEAS